MKQSSFNPEYIIRRLVLLLRYHIGGLERNVKLLGAEDIRVFLNRRQGVFAVFTPQAYNALRRHTVGLKLRHKLSYTEMPLKLLAHFLCFFKRYALYHGEPLRLVFDNVKSAVAELLNKLFCG